MIFNKDVPFFFLLNIYLFGCTESWLWHAGSLVAARMWDLVPQPGIKPGPPALGAWSLNSLTTREVPGIFFFEFGDADRKHCKFKPDPSIPPTFSAFNEDYVGSGWSRGHMAPAGDNKFSSKAMAETFYLSNIVPQNFDNNAGYWNRIEMYCRELTERFEDVWIVSGPLTLPQTGSDGKKTVSYQVIGQDNVAVPSHLYKVILARRSPGSAEPLALGAFVVPNEAIGFQPQLSEFQVSLQDLEKLSGLVFFPHLDRTSDIRNICSVDTCKLLDFREFTLYLSTRKIEGARSVHRLEKVMENLRNAGIEPDEYFMTRYKKKLEELKAQEQSGVLEKKPS
ncbi:nuclease EXOG, mitochondrial isoform X2 [Hippopotamus amphibius kiboko]|uniref:nuclease EXOG, mitochondrial isoform X2 n=1 Tax=Hippopotamus amphibius kiboko TaxID=575201 RepID=UPI0025921F58|nr:nuclease EXOG, mitochondrial isoform X2 [Hippopotamus amphibius kiboko]